MERKAYEFISKQMSDPILEWRTCKWTGEEFPIFQGDKELLEKVSPRIGGKKYSLPLPTLSREARKRRRLMWRNDRKIYKAICKVTDKPLVTFYHPDLDTNVVEHKQWYKSIENTTCGMDFDFTKSFHSQFAELMNKTVKKNILTVGIMENSDYTHNAGDLKDCYMLFDTGMCENCMHAVRIVSAKYVNDCFEVHDSEQVYDSVSIYESRNIFYSQNSIDCSFSAFIYNCLGCHNCICCSNLVNKSYYAFNKPVSKEEYRAIWAELFDGSRGSYQKFEKKYITLLSSTLRKNLNMTNTEDSVGHNLSSCRNVFLCEETTGSGNVRYSDRVNGYDRCADNMDISSWGRAMNTCYELNCCGSDTHTTASNCQFGSQLYRGVTDTQYSVNIPSMSNFLFGCAEIDKKQYHILNKAYTKQEYETLVPKIIDHMTQTGEWGEFLDPTYSPFPYNDTIACDYYPIHTLKYPDGTSQVYDAQGTGVLTIHEPDKTISSATLDLGGEQKIATKRRTREQEVNVPENLQKINASELPENINDVENDICDKAILCAKTGRPFRIVKQELEFYRKHKLPLPTFHPDIRHLGRLKKMIHFDLSLRTCDNCGVEMVSVYKPGMEFEVYCEQCYNKEIYG